MKALSIRQPWAHHILFDGKDVENRSWSTNFRGPFLIHAGKSFDSDCIELHMLDGAHIYKRACGDIELAPWRKLNEFSLGAIIGVAEIVDCRQKVSSPWGDLFQYKFVLENPRAFISPREYRGRLRFFDAPEFEFDGVTVSYCGVPMFYKEQLPCMVK